MQIPNLDFNDRLYLMNIILKIMYLNKIILLNKKYGTEYQILINSIKKNNIIIYDVNIFYNNQKYFVLKFLLKI